MICQKSERNPTRKRFERLKFFSNPKTVNFHSFTVAVTILIHCLYLKEIWAWLTTTRTIPPLTMATPRQLLQQCSHRRACSACCHRKRKALCLSVSSTSLHQRPKVRAFSHPRIEPVHVSKQSILSFATETLCSEHLQLRYTCAALFLQRLFVQKEVKYEEFCLPPLSYNTSQT